jgi:hypothetical protein
VGQGEVSSEFAFDEWRMTNYGAENARNHRHGLYALQTAELLVHEKQEKRSGSVGTEQIL